MSFNVIKLKPKLKEIIEFEACRLWAPLPELPAHPRPQQHVPGSEAASSPSHSTLP